MLFGDSRVDSVNSRIRNLLLNRRGVSTVISEMIMVTAVIVAGFAVLSWASSRSSDANQQYANTTQTNVDTIGERIALEAIPYSENTLTVYMINCGRSNGVSVRAVYIWDNNSQLVGFYSNLQLNFLNGTPTSSLNVGAEGYFVISDLNLEQNLYHSIRVETMRGMAFYEKFSS